MKEVLVHSRTLKVKVCGVTSRPQVQKLQEFGIDLIGCILVDSSPRKISLDFFSELSNEFSQNLVPVVRDRSFEMLLPILNLQIRYLQFHGEESVAYCEKVKNLSPSVSLIKAFSIDENTSWKKIHSYEGICDYFLFDSGSGGSGRCFDWSLVGQYQGNTPIIIAGGIGNDNVLDVIGTFSGNSLPFWGVDINSAVEVSPGVKDMNLVSQFIQTVQAN